MGEEELGAARLPDTVEGFADFYKLIYQRELPAHGLSWIQSLYAAREEGKGLVVEAFRGSSKTTTLTIAFTAFRIGLEPHKSNLLIQAVDKAAHDTAQQIADLIEHNAGWQGAFPKVRPDKSVAWGDNGFEVMDIGLHYDKWRAVCAKKREKIQALLDWDTARRQSLGNIQRGCWWWTIFTMRTIRTRSSS